VAEFFRRGELTAVIWESREMSAKAKVAAGIAVSATYHGASTEYARPQIASRTGVGLSGPASTARNRSLSVMSDLRRSGWTAAMREFRRTAVGIAGAAGTTPFATCRGVSTTGTSRRNSTATSVQRRGVKIAAMRGYRSTRAASATAAGTTPFRTCRGAS